MVQLKQVLIRLKSIKNIQKITKTMKMVAASKFTKAERELKAARPFGYGPRKFYETARLVLGPVDDKPDQKNVGEKKKKAKDFDDSKGPVVHDAKDKNVKRIFIAMTSDRVVGYPTFILGLCGGVHSGVTRRVRREFTERKADSADNKLICVGDKSRSMLRRNFPQHMLASVKDVGRISPRFTDASLLVSAIYEAGYSYDIGEIFYNKYFSPVKYELNSMPIFNKTKIETAPNLTAFDDVDDDALESYTEWTLAALLYYALKEGAASEQSARMAAMDNATKNAEDMIKKLTLLFNRTRQSVITRELIEIISGAAALMNTK